MWVKLMDKRGLLFWKFSNQWPKKMGIMFAKHIILIQLFVVLSTCRALMIEHKNCGPSKVVSLELTGCTPYSTQGMCTVRRGDTVTFKAHFVPSKFFLCAAWKSFRLTEWNCYSSRLSDTLQSFDSKNWIYWVFPYSIYRLRSLSQLHSLSNCQTKCGPNCSQLHSTNKDTKNKILSPKRKALSFSFWK